MSVIRGKFRSVTFLGRTFPWFIFDFVYVNFERLTNAQHISMSFIIRSVSVTCGTVHARSHTLYLTRTHTQQPTTPKSNIVQWKKQTWKIFLRQYDIAFRMAIMVLWMRWAEILLFYSKNFPSSPVQSNGNISPCNSNSVHRKADNCGILCVMSDATMSSRGRNGTKSKREIDLRRRNTHCICIRNVIEKRSLDPESKS